MAPSSPALHGVDARCLLGSAALGRGGRGKEGEKCLKTATGDRWAPAPAEVTHCQAGKEQGEV